MYLLFEIFITIIGYGLLFYGIWLLSWPLLMDARRFRVRSQRLRKNQRKEIEKLNNVKKHPLFLHIRKLVFSLSADTNEKRLWNFYGISIALLIAVTFSIGVLTSRYDLAIVGGILMAFMPYAFLRYRIMGVRLDGSLAFMKEFHIFMQAYQKNKDVYHTVYEVTHLLHDKRLRMNFQKLLSSMQKNRTEEGFLDAVQLFAFSLNSSYAIRFTNLLVKSYRDNGDIIEGLMDIHRDLRKRERDMEVLKTKRIETVILGFMPLIFIPIFIFMALRVTMMYEMSFLVQQTTSVIGLIIAAFLAIASAMCSLLMSKPRADL